MHAIVAGVFQGCCSRAVQGKSGDLKTGDEVHISLWDHKQPWVVFCGLLLHMVVLSELGWLLFNNVLFGH